IFNSGTLTVTGCVVLGNTSKHGPAIFNSGTMAITSDFEGGVINSVFNSVEIVGSYNYTVGGNTGTAISAAYNTSTKRIEFTVNVVIAGSTNSPSSGTINVRDAQGKLIDTYKLTAGDKGSHVFSATAARMLWSQGPIYAEYVGAGNFQSSIS